MLDLYLLTGFVKGGKAFILLFVAGITGIVYFTRVKEVNWLSNKTLSFITQAFRLGNEV